MIDNVMDQYIREISLNISGQVDFKTYPFVLPSVKALQTLKFHPNVTFLVGENGSGKSTLLEAISVAFGFNPEGGSRHFSFSTRHSHSELHQHLKLTRGARKVRDGFFLRAESFYNVATNVDGLGPEILEAYGGKSLHDQSHGESFISLMMNRFKGNGLYVLDEPEAALSPTRQLALLRRIHQLVELDSQLIIATHSPIILAYPHAKILDVDNGYQEIDYRLTDHYMITKEFLLHPDRMLELIL